MQTKRIAIPNLFVCWESIASVRTLIVIIPLLSKGMISIGKSIFKSKFSAIFSLESPLAYRLADKWFMNVS